MSYKRLDSEDIVLSSNAVTAPAWSNGSDTLSTFTTASAQGISQNYYTDIVIGNDNQFSIAYANKNGCSEDSGSVGNTYDAAATVYGQIRSMVFGSEDQDLTFNCSSEHLDDVVASGSIIISLDRSRFREKISIVSKDRFELSFTQNLVLTVDIAENSPINYIDSGRIIRLTEKSLPTGVEKAEDYGDIGYLLPDIGVIIINEARYLRECQSTVKPIATTRQEIIDQFKNDLVKFVAMSEETVASNYLFLRIRNSEFNYSTNPTLLNNNGEIRYGSMINNPQAFITAIGLYNDAGDLLAVAKLSRPLQKDFTKEALINVKLNF